MIIAGAAHLPYIRDRQKDKRSIMTEHIELTPKEEIFSRIGRLRQSMGDAGIDFCVIMQNVDMYYFTGTVQKGTLVVSVEGDPIFFVEKSAERAVSETPLAITAIKRDRDIKDVLLSRKVLRGRGAMELDVIPVSVFERFKGIVGFEAFVNATPLVKGLREIKSAFELDQVRKSGAIMRHVFAKAREVIAEDLRELDIDAELIAEGRRRGHQGFLRMRGFNLEMTTITVANGLTAALPSPSDVPVGGRGVTPAIPMGSSQKKIEKGIPICIDYGGGYNGYVTDETYVFVIGKMKEKYRLPYETSRRILDDAMAFGREGVDAVELYERAAAIAKKAGLTDNFMGFGEGKVSFVGHGLGLEINELPVITARHHTALREGMVFAFEPKFVLPNQGSIGVELDFIVRKNGLERVTDIPPNIVYL